MMARISWQVSLGKHVGKYRCYALNLGFGLTTARCKININIAGATACGKEFLALPLKKTIDR